MNSLTEKDLIAIQAPNISVSEGFQIFVQLLLRNGEKLLDCLDKFGQYEADNAEKLIEILQKNEMDILSFLDKKIEEISEDFTDIHMNLILINLILKINKNVKNKTGFKYQIFSMFISLLCGNYCLFRDKIFSLFRLLDRLIIN